MQIQKKQLIKRGKYFKMNNNQKLFFYGFKANLIQFIGILLMMFGIFSIAFFDWVISLLILIIGLIIYTYGKSLRFDYQRKSGYIVHGGD